MNARVGKYAPAHGGMHCNCCRVGTKSRSKRNLNRDTRRKAKVAVKTRVPHDDYDPWLD